MTETVPVSERLYHASSQRRSVRTQIESKPLASETTGAGDGVRTRDLKLGKLVLYQLSYTRMNHRSDLSSSEFKRCAGLRQAPLLPGQGRIGGSVCVVGKIAGDRVLPLPGRVG